MRKESRYALHYTARAEVCCEEQHSDDTSGDGGFGQTSLSGGRPRQLRSRRFGGYVSVWRAVRIRLRNAIGALVGASIWAFGSHEMQMDRMTDKVQEKC